MERCARGSTHRARSKWRSTASPRRRSTTSRCSRTSSACTSRCVRAGATGRRDRHGIHRRSRRTWTSTISPRRCSTARSRRRLPRRRAGRAPAGRTTPGDTRRRVDAPVAAGTSALRAGINPFKSPGFAWPLAPVGSTGRIPQRNFLSEDRTAGTTAAEQGARHEQEHETADHHRIDRGAGGCADGPAGERPADRRRIPASSLPTKKPRRSRDRRRSRESGPSKARSPSSRTSSPGIPTTSRRARPTASRISTACGPPHR